MNWQCAFSDIGYLLDKASCVPDLKFHFGDRGRDLVSVCLGQGGQEQAEKKGPAWRAPGHKHPKERKIAVTLTFNFQKLSDPSACPKHWHVNDKATLRCGSRFPKGEWGGERPSSSGKGNPSFPCETKNFWKIFGFLASAGATIDNTPGAPCALAASLVTGLASALRDSSQMM